MSDEQPPPEPQPDQPKKPGKFQKGDGRKRGPSVNALMRLREGVPYKQPKKDGAPDELMDMRHVLLNGAKFDLTEQQIFLRKIKNDDPKGFLLMVNAAEEKHRKIKEEKKRAAQEAAPATQPDAEPVELDDGTARCIELCEQLLEDCR